MNQFKNNIKKDTLIRLSHSHKQEFKGYYLKKYYYKSGFKLNIDQNLRDLQQNARLNFFNYYSTGMLENFILNIPSVCYLERDFEYQNNFFNKKVKHLLEAKIVFFNKEKFISHVLDIWEDIDSWWLNKKTQKLIERFNNNFNFSGKNLNELKRNITN